MADHPPKSLDDLFAPLELDASQWVAFEATIANASAHLPPVVEHMPVEFVDPSDPDWRDGLFSEVVIQEAEHLEPLVFALEYYRQHGLWPEQMPQRAIYWLSAFLDQLVLFVPLLYDHRTNRTLFPCPAVPPRSLVAYFFHHWWLGEGQRQWAHRASTDKHTFASYFQLKPYTEE